MNAMATPTRSAITPPMVPNTAPKMAAVSRWSGLGVAGADGVSEGDAPTLADGEAVRVPLGVPVGAAVWVDVPVGGAVAVLVVEGVAPVLSDGVCVAGAVADAEADGLGVRVPVGEALAVLVVDDDAPVLALGDCVAPLDGDGLGVIDELADGLAASVAVAELLALGSDVGVGDAVLVGDSLGDGVNDGTKARQLPAPSHCQPLLGGSNTGCPLGHRMPRVGGVWIWHTAALQHSVE